MNVVFINTTLESFTPTKSGAIGTWIWEVCQAAKRDGVEPLVISLRDDAEPYPWTKAVFLDYPRHDFNEGWKRILRKVFVLQAKFGGWYHMRHPAWARRVGDAIQRAGAANSPRERSAPVGDDRNTEVENESGCRLPARHVLHSAAAVLGRLALRAHSRHPGRDWLSAEPS